MLRLTQQISEGGQVDNITTSNEGDITKGMSSVPTDITNDQSGNASSFDPLANFSLGGSDQSNNADGKLEFNPNETIRTSDKSSVGGYTEVKNKVDEPESGLSMPLAPEPPVMAPEPEVSVNSKSDFVITDPAKMDFVKTYTREYDDLVAAATHAVELILTSIDRTVKEHASQIDIPEEAVALLDEKPEGGKVSKFDEAQTIVRTIMAKASQAKKEGEQAAIEAAKIYDGIQQFKRDTEKEIQLLRSRDEFGNTKDSNMSLN